MQSKLQGKKIIVTGASSGIGAMLVKQIAANGGTPIMLARSLDKLRQLNKQIKEEYNVTGYYYKVDLTNNVETDDCFATILHEHEQIYCIVNNAGAGVFNYVSDTKWHDIELMYHLNVLAVIRITKLMLAHFIKHQEGHIINIASQAGKIATPKSAVYASTKHAVLGFTNALRQEIHSKNIHITAVNLGPVRTNFFSMADPDGNYQKNVEKFMLDPNKVANEIIHSMFTNKREINMPMWMNFGSKLYQLFPGIMEKALKKQFNKK